MLKKIFFGDKPLFLSKAKTEELKPYINDKGTVLVKNIEKEDLRSVIAKMQEKETSAGIVLYNVTEAFNEFRKEFTLIQASGGLVYNGDKILLIFRRGKWDLPKGKLDDGEDLIQCALREVKEETGLNDLSVDQTLCTSYHTYYEGGKHILKESHWHLLKGNQGETLTPQLDEDIEKCKWVQVDELAGYLKQAPASIIDVVEKGLQVLGEKGILN